LLPLPLRGDATPPSVPQPAQPAPEALAGSRVLAPAAPADGTPRKRRRVDADASAGGHGVAAGAAGAPWVPLGAAYPERLDDALSAELLHLETWADLTPAERAARELLLSRVAALAAAAAPAHEPPQARAFGSLAAGLSTFDSDVDVCLHGARGTALLRPVAQALQASGWASDVDYRATARVPIVAFVDKLTGVAADVSMEASGDATTTAVRRMSGEWPGLFRPLLLFLKMALSEADLNKPFTGGLGSFKLCALLALYLGRAEAAAARKGSALQPGACLLGFLEYVARRFDFDSVLDFAGLRADFRSVFAWQSVVAFARETAAALLEPRAPSDVPPGVLHRVLPGSRLGAARARSAQRAAAAAAAAGVAPESAVRSMPPPYAPTSLHVFDFDGTLVDTPGPAEGRELLRSLGTPWPHRGWWGHAGSLLPPLPLRPGPALGAYAAACATPGALVVLLTGRRRELRAEVHAALAAHGMRRIDEDYFADGDADTLSFKLAVLRRLAAARRGALHAVHVYEDRGEHAAAFAELAGTHAPPGCAWHVHHVGPEAPQQQPARNAAASKLPRFSCDGYLRLIVPVPAEAAAVPRAWREAKAARDGEGEAHITLLNRAETADVVVERLQAGESEEDIRASITQSLEDLLACPRGSLGIGVAAGDGGAAAYLALKWAAAADFRRSLGLPQTDFHITLGFTGTGDPHGVAKGVETVLIRGAGDGEWQGWRSRGALRAAIVRRAEELMAPPEAPAGEDDELPSGASDEFEEDEEESRSSSFRSRSTSRSSSFHTPLAGSASDLAAAYQ
jgi:hypothetical protein